MLKKSLIALAIASVAGSVSAVEIKTPTNLLSKQGAVKEYVKVNAIDESLAGQLQVKLQAEYSVGDTITLTFSGAELLTKNSEFLPKAVLKTVGSKEPATMTIGVLNVDKTSATFRVTSLDYPDTFTQEEKTSIDGTIVFNGIKLKTADVLANGQASVTYAAKTNNGLDLDTGTAGSNTKVLFQARDQFTATVFKPFDSVVDVNADRLLFTDKNKDSEITLTVTDLNGTKEKEGDSILYFAYPAALTKSSFVVNGDFAFLGEADEDGLIKLSKDAKVYGNNQKLKVFTDRLEFDNMANDLELASAIVTVPGDVTIPHQTFTATAKLAYSAGGNNNVGSVDFNFGETAGQWKLNGAVYHVPYMPFRAGFSPIVNISNVSKQDGAIEVIVYQQDNAWVAPKSYNLETVAKAEAQTNITPELRTLGIEGDVAFDIIVNAPSKDIAVNALYFQGGDRAVIKAHDRSTKN